MTTEKPSLATELLHAIGDKVAQEGWTDETVAMLKILMEYELSEIDPAEELRLIFHPLLFTWFVDHFPAWEPGT